MRAFLLLVFLLLVSSLAQAATTHSGQAGSYNCSGNAACEATARSADVQGVAVVEGCRHEGSASLVSAPMACRAYTGTAPTDYLEQAAVAVNYANFGAGPTDTCWLALHSSVATTVPGWTRQVGTHYLGRCDTHTFPAPAPAGVLVVAKVTLTGGAMTAVVDVAPRIFTGAVAVSSPWTTGPESVWIFRPGATLTPQAPVIIGGAVVNPSNQAIFLPGASTVVFTPTALQPVVVTWFGALPDGSADVSPAVNRAIAALPLRGHLHFPPGTYLATAGFTPLTNALPTGQNSTSVRVTCAGREATQILFTPTATATLFTFDATGGVAYRMQDASLEECAVYSAGLATKTIVYVGDTDGFRLTNVLMNNTGAGSGDTTSIGLHVDHNPQAAIFTGLTIYNYPHPVILGTHAQAQVFDHLAFQQLFALSVTQNPSVNALIEVKDGSQLQSVTFHDTIGVGGRGLFTWQSPTTASGDLSYGLTFSGGRYEDGALPTMGRVFDIQPNAAKKLTNLRIAGMTVAVPGVGGTAFYVRNTQSLTIQDVYVGGQQPGGILYDMDGSNDSMLFLNVTGFSNATGTEIFAGQVKKIFGTGRENVTPATPEPIKYYQAVRTNKGEDTQYWQMLNHRVYTANPTIAQAATITIPPANSALSIAQVFVSFTAGADNPGGCHLMMYVATPGAGDTVMKKISGTANCVDAIPAADQIGVYTSPGDNTIKITNFAVGDRRFSIVIYYVVLNALP